MNPLKMDKPAPKNGGLVVWFTGLPGSGKSTLCDWVQVMLKQRGVRSIIIDADEARKTFNAHLGFSKEDRDENVRRIGMVANIIARQGVHVLVACISPYRDIRDEIRAKTRNFIEVYLDCPLEVCEHRDPKGLYRKAREGKVEAFTGVSDPYEPPVIPHMVLRTDLADIRDCAEQVTLLVLIREHTREVLKEISDEEIADQIGKAVPYL